MRLDTHLKNSPFCKAVQQSDSQTSTVPTVPPQSDTVVTVSYHLPDKDSLVTEAPPDTKPPLKLPFSKEDWEMADSFFSENLVPSVHQATSAEEKNSILADGIYNYFATQYGVRQIAHRASRKQKKDMKHQKHDRALKRVTELKNKARRDFRQAKRQGSAREEIQSLARNFFDLVRQQSALKKRSKQNSETRSAKTARQHCHKHFWKFTRELLDDSAASKVTPDFSREEAFCFFSDTYSSTPKEFEKPDWMPAPRPPDVEFEVDLIVPEEVRAVIKRAKSASSPSPFDQIPYQIFKKCPSLAPALVDLFNCCWTTATIPSAWKTAAIKLIGKSTAPEDATTPSNFRPIALTSCTGKLFTTILKNRWLEHMLDNGYLDRSIQKAFMRATPGCTEHHSKLATILSEARRKHKSLAVSWLDLANAYGSVHHTLIQFAMKHYHAPPQLCMILESLYSDLSAAILTPEWSTPSIPLKIGVYQGDPLSVVVFNTVINTLVDTLQVRNDLGYTLSDSTHRINLLQYADDTCVIANTPAACQQLLNMVDRWLEWSGMKAKVAKCHSVAIQSSTGHTMDPQLTLSGQSLPFLGNGTIRFLGLPVQIPQNPSTARLDLKQALRRMLQAVDRCPVTRRQKLKLYKLGICPRLNWPLTIYEFPISWIERELETMATKFLKQWAGLAKSANPNLLYLPQKEGGLTLPALSSLYKQLQVSRQCQILTSADPCVRRIAEKGLQAEASAQRMKFRPAVVARDTMQEDPSCSRRALVAAAKKRVANDEKEARLTDLRNLPRQGHMIRSTTPNTATIWAKAVQSLPEEPFKFVLNAAHDTLPHNANLHLWRKKASDTCPLCREDSQNLIHVLNSCRVALELRRYNERHDSVLTVLYDTITQHLPTTSSCTVDLANQYSFPSHIVTTELRPDIVWWDDTNKSVCLVELTVCFDTLLHEAADRKESKYLELLSTIKEAGYRATLVTVEVGSRGLPNILGFEKLKHELKLTSTQTSDFMVEAAKKAIMGSFSIWCRRNRT